MKLGKKAEKQQALLKKAIQCTLPLAGLFAALPLSACGENNKKGLMGKFRFEETNTVNQQEKTPLARGVRFSKEKQADREKTVPGTAGIPVPPVKEQNTVNQQETVLPMGIMIPPAEENPEKTGVYAVKPGDTLSKIARQYGISIEKLKKLNNFTDKQADKLQINQKIIVPKKN